MTSLEVPIDRLADGTGRLVDGRWVVLTSCFVLRSVKHRRRDYVLISLLAVVLTSCSHSLTSLYARCKSATRFLHYVHLTVQFPTCTARRKLPYTMSSGHHLKSKYDNPITSRSFRVLCVVLLPISKAVGHVPSSSDWLILPLVFGCLQSTVFMTWFRLSVVPSWYLLPVA